MKRVNYNRHSNQYSTRDPRGLYLMLGIMATGFILKTAYDPQELHYPLVGSVQAQELPVKTIVQPLNTYNAPKYMVDYIQSLFGEDTQNILTIVGTCENGTWDQTRTNTNKNGTKDYGIAQINEANSKLCKGLDFKNDWRDNLTCAHRVYKSQGLSAWSCSYTVGIVPFYLKNN